MKYYLQSRLQDERWEYLEDLGQRFNSSESAIDAARKLDGFFYGMVRVLDDRGNVIVEFPAISSAEKEKMPIKKLIRDVHTSHCCNIPGHGCKYGDPNCTVMLGMPQEGPCEQCGLELEGYYGPEEQQIAARRWSDDFRAQDVRDQQTPPEDVAKVLSQVVEECKKARAKHPPLNSTHEAHSVILEEFEEWWDSVKADEPDDKELLSVAAMAVLAIVELKGKNRRN
jgi:hypothetical protein